MLRRYSAAASFRLGNITSLIGESLRLTDGKGWLRLSVLQPGGEALLELASEDEVPPERREQADRPTAQTPPQLQRRGKALDASAADVEEESEEDESGREATTSSSHDGEDEDGDSESAEPCAAEPNTGGGDGAEGAAAPGGKDTGGRHLFTVTWVNSMLALSADAARAAFPQQAATLRAKGGMRRGQSGGTPLDAKLVYLPRSGGDGGRLRTLPVKLAVTAGNFRLNGAGDAVRAIGAAKCKYLQLVVQPGRNPRLEKLASMPKRRRIARRSPHGSGGASSSSGSGSTSSDGEEGEWASGTDSASESESDSRGSFMAEEEEGEEGEEEEEEEEEEWEEEEEEEEEEKSSASSGSDGDFEGGDGPDTGGDSDGGGEQGSDGGADGADDAGVADASSGPRGFIVTWTPGQLLLNQKAAAAAFPAQYKALRRDGVVPQPVALDYTMPDCEQDGQPQSHPVKLARQSRRLQLRVLPPEPKAASGSGAAGRVLAELLPEADPEDAKECGAGSSGEVAPSLALPAPALEPGTGLELANAAASAGGTALPCSPGSAARTLAVLERAPGQPVMCGAPATAGGHVSEPACEDARRNPQLADVESAAVTTAPGQVRVCGVTFDAALAPAVRSVEQAFVKGLGRELRKARPTTMQLSVVGAIPHPHLSGNLVCNKLARLLGLEGEEDPWDAPLPEGPVVLEGAMQPCGDPTRGGAGLRAAEALKKNTVLGVVGGYVMPAAAAEDLVCFGRKHCQPEVAARLAGVVAGTSADVVTAWRLLAGIFRLPLPAGLTALQKGELGDGEGGKAPPAASVEASMLGYGNLIALVNDPRIVKSQDPAEKANCAVVPVSVRGLVLPVLVALRDIAPGEQLLRDCGADWWQQLASDWEVAEHDGLDVARLLRLVQSQAAASPVRQPDRGRNSRTRSGPRRRRGRVGTAAGLAAAAPGPVEMVLGTFAVQKGW
ncbi:hypothetical protein GPECTOR_30g168 [Gonium pectorale]|uniref:SET domain-containing protein n=1 Tax=Gonium pectorale TaxID=33097 RepID=A0A150GE71_GONPE|nr:hypothetical protein GPECTOR_30g168 [Gonium pectorale]|eukprot:KXZ48073.1 hypothetical protein GPECTOR_30g168 [Gonium pectorale]